MGARRKKFIIGCALLGMLGITGMCMKAEEIDARVGSVKVELVSDGSVPFDNVAGPGKDIGPNNGIVRSFDEAIYDLSFALDGQDSSKLYDVEVTGILPDINTANKLQLEWDTTGIPQEGLEVLKSGSEIKFTLKDIRVGQLFSKSLRMKTQAIGNNINIHPIFLVNIKGDEDINAVVSECNTNVVSTTKTNLDVALHYEDAMPVSEVNSRRGRVLSAGFTLKSEGSENLKGKGIGFTEDDVKIVVKVEGASNSEFYDITDIATPDRDGNIAFGGNIPMSKKEHGGINSIDNSGILTCNPLGNGRYELTLKGYKLSNHYPSYARDTGPVESFIPPHVKYYSSGIFKVFVPFDANSRDSRINMYIESVEAKTNDNLKVEDIDGSNNRVSNEYKVSETSRYGMQGFSADGKGHQLERPHNTGANGRIAKGTPRTELGSYLWATGHTSKYEAAEGGIQTVMMFEGNLVKLTEDVFLEGPNIKEYERWYGVGKLSRSEIISGSANLKSLEWFDSLEVARSKESEQQGKFICAVMCDSKEPFWANGLRHAPQRIYVAPRNPNSLPDFQTIVSNAVGKVFLDKERKNSITTNSSYSPTRYNSDGTTILSSRILGPGSTTQITPYLTEVNVRAVDRNGNNTAIIDTARSRDTEWVINPKLIDALPSGTNDDIVIKHTLPSGMKYKDGTANIAPNRVLPQSDGTTEIEWILRGHKVNGNLQEIKFKTSIELGTAHGIRYKNSVVISSRGDVRDANYFRNASYEVSVVNESAVFITQSTQNEKIESGDIINYDIGIFNNSKKDYTNCKILNILPYNGDALKSNYKGTVTLNGINVPSGTSVQYTDISSSEIKRDMSNINSITWKNYSGGDVKATAVLITCPKLLKASEYPMSMQLKTEGNRHDNTYVNQSYASMEGLDFKISGDVARSTVTSRDIEGSVWLDKDSNGLNDDSSSIANAKVTLLDENNKPLRDVKTDNQGIYNLMDVRPGNYKLKFENVGKNLMPTKVVENEHGNYLNNDNFITDTFTLKSEDLEKRINLGLVSSISLNKKCNTAITYPGGEIEYIIDVTNNSNSPSNDIQVIDELSKTLSAIESSISNEGIYHKDDNMITWDIKQLAGKESKQLKFKCTISEDIKGDITNIAYIKEYKDTTSGVSNTSAVKTLEYNLKSNKVESDLLKAGDDLTYTLSVTNPSNQKAEGISVSSQIPEGLALVNESISDNGKLKDNQLDWTVDIEPNTTKDITYSTNVKLPNKSVEDIKNKFTINKIKSNEVTNKVGKANIEVRVNADKVDITEDGILKYDVAVINTGNVISEDLNYKAENPKGTTFIEDTLTEPLTNGQFVKSLGKLKPNESTTLRYSVKINDVNRELNSFDVVHISEVEDKYLGTIKSNTVTTKVLLPRLNSKQTASSNELLTVDEDLIYTINISNDGEAKEKKIHVESIIPDNTEVKSSSDGAIVSDGKIYWDLQELPKDESVTLKYTVKLKRGKDTYWVVDCNTTVNGKDINPLSNAVAIGDLQYIMEVDNQEATVGDILKYSIIVKNEGDYPIENISVKAIKPEGTEVIGDTEWNVHKLGARSSKVLTYKCKVKNLKENITKDWIMSEALVNGNKSNNVYSEITIDKLKYDKICSVNESSIIPAGEEVDYTINVSNVGDRTSFDVKIEENLPDYAELISVDDGKKKLFRNQLEWNIEKLEPKETKTFKYKIRTVAFPSSNTDNWQINSESIINGKPALNNSVNVGVPRIKVTNEVDNTKVREDEILDLKIKATNNGAVGSKGFTVKTDIGDKLDILPEQNKDIVVDNKNISWKLDKLDKGQSKDTVVKVRVKKLADNSDGDNINVKNTVEGDSHSTVTSDLNLDVIKPKLSFSKSANSVSNLSVNDLITYNIEVENKGTASCDKVDIKDTIPKGTTLVNGEPNKVIENLESGQKANLKFSVKINPNDTEQKWKISNTAVVNGTNTNTVEHIAKYYKTDKKDLTDHVTDALDKVVGWQINSKQESDDWKKEYEFNAGGKSNKPSVTTGGTVDANSKDDSESSKTKEQSSKDTNDKKVIKESTLPKLIKDSTLRLVKTGTNNLAKIILIPSIILVGVAVFIRRKYRK